MGSGNYCYGRSCWTWTCSSQFCDGLSALFFVQVFASSLQMSWDGDARTAEEEIWRWGGSIKGIITVIPEDVHSHSVKQTVGREESTLPSIILPYRAPQSLSSTQPPSGKSNTHMITWYNGTEGKKFKKKNTLLFLLSGCPQSLLPCNSWVSSYLCCRNPWVPSGPAGCRTVWLFDRVSSKGNVELMRPGLTEREVTGIN